MVSPDQDAFLAKIRSALGHRPHVRRRVEALFPTEPASESQAILKRIRLRTDTDRHILLETLKVAAVPINLRVKAFVDETRVRRDICRLVDTAEPEWGSEKSVAAWRHPLIDRLDLPDALQPQGVPVYRPPADPVSLDDLSVRRTWRHRVEKAFIGITSADFCMADTATLVLRTRPGQDRFVSVVPSIHVAVIGLEHLIADLKELYALLRWDPDQRQEGLTRYMGFVSGPSKTADIEATMVHGAHGPREVYLYVVTG